MMALNTLPATSMLVLCCLAAGAWGAKRARDSAEDWGMKRAVDSDELWGSKRARGSDEDWGMLKRARDSAEDWGMKKRARDSAEDWGMKKRARDSAEDWGMKKRARDSAEDWGMKRAVDSSELWGSKKKRSQCGRQGDSCYSTEYCCKSFVCAVSDEHEMKPEVPGVCLHEKELTPCTSDQACPSHERCARLTANAPARYCVARPAAPARPVLLPAFGASVKAAAATIGTGSKTGAGGLGATCSDNNDCQAHTDSGDKLCCQKVSMGRQGNKQICDRITSSSSCITKR